MKKINFLSNIYFRGIALVLAGLFIGWLLFRNTSTAPSESTIHDHSDAEKTIWTCAMHPQIRMDKAGKCPICGMELIPLKKTNAEIDDQAIEMSESAMKLAEVQTSIVGLGSISKEIRLYGKIQPDERLLQSQTAHVPGRIEKLYVNVTGETVKKGQLIAQIYSPELITAQKELLEAITLNEKYPNILEAAREKLRNWKLSDEQIKNIEKSGKVSALIDLYANTSGIITARKVNEGDYINRGAVLFDVADLSKIWAVFDAYESDLPWIRLGQTIKFTTQAVPGKTFEGSISFIDPVIDPATRIARVRVELSNSNLQLKPELFVNGVVNAHQKSTSQQLIIPQSAVLWTGTRSIVYIKIPGTEFARFKMREITLGASMTDSFIVLDGLKSGEEIVVNGSFSVDAAAQLAGKPSMMNHEGGKVSIGHNHGGMNMNLVNKDDHTEYRDKNIKEEHKTQDKIYMESTSHEINPQFKKQLTEVYKTYLLMKNAFVKSDPLEIAKITGEVKNALNGVDMMLLKGETHKIWMNQLANLKASLEKMGKNENVTTQREAFAAFNLDFYQTVKYFGLDNVTLYYQYCPMAVEQKGAYWFSEYKEIKNPYFGEAMLKCGETSETLTY
jgi:membrane fusion protein, copper/silver efflux system